MRRSFRFQLYHLVAVTVVAASACDGDDLVTGPPPAPELARTVVTGSGDITAKVNEFRALLGEPRNGGQAGPQPAGRREIGWDGVPPQLNNQDNTFPAGFFGNLGAIFTTNGSGFRNDSTLFVDVNPTYAQQFAFFSATKTFAAVGSNVLDVNFQLAGLPTPAVVSGFGAVFSDVDVAGPTAIEYFRADGTRLGRYEAPVRTDAAGLALVGVKFDSTVVARVRITLGQAALGAGANDVSDGGTSDLVIVDDFLYGEPQPAF